MSVKRVQSEMCLHESRQCVEGIAHIDRLCANEDLCRRRNTQHCDSLTALNTFTNRRSGGRFATITFVPPGKINSSISSSTASNGATIGACTSTNGLVCCRCSDCEFAFSSSTKLARQRLNELILRPCCLQYSARLRPLFTCANTCALQRRSLSGAFLRVRMAFLPFVSSTLDLPLRSILSSRHFQ